VLTLSEFSFPEELLLQEQVVVELRADVADELEQTDDHLLFIGRHTALHLVESLLRLLADSLLNILLRAEVLLLIVLEVFLPLLPVLLDLGLRLLLRLLQALGLSLTGLVDLLGGSLLSSQQLLNPSGLRCHYSLNTL